MSGLREFGRVLKPGGQLGILDFAEPGGLMGKVYAVYFRRVLPAIGRMISGPVAAGKVGPYSYLPASVGSFPPPAQMLELMRANRLHKLRVAAVYVWNSRAYTGVRAPIA